MAGCAAGAPARPAPPAPCAGAACLDLARQAEAGADREADPQEAAALAARACDDGHGPACRWLGERSAGQRSGAPADARRLFTRGCDLGDAPACREAGLLALPHPAGRAALERACALGDGSGCWNAALLEDDPARAARLQRDACDLGSPEGCWRLGRAALRAPRGDAPWPAREAAALLRFACERGAHGACADLAPLLDAGYGVEADPAEARRLAARACEHGVAAGCGFTAAHDPTPDATARLLDACQADHAPSCLHAAARALDAAPPDRPRALLLWERACALGEPAACARLPDAPDAPRLCPLPTEDACLQADLRAPDAADRLDQGCARGWPRACHHRALLSLRGDGAPYDPHDALPRLQTACDGGLAASCHLLGRLYDQAVATPADPLRAAFLYRAACNAGVLPACADLAALLQAGRGARRDPDHARHLLQRACQGGVAAACRHLADDLPPDQAAPLYRAACNLLDPAACEALADLLLASPRLDDALQGRAWLRLACERGQPDPCRRLAADLPGPQGDALLERACALEHPPACLDAADRAKHPADAALYHLRACRAGDPHGCGAFGQDTLEGRGVPPDPAAALPYLGAACRGEDAAACRLLALLVTQGRVLPPNAPFAAALLRRACALGDEISCKMISNND